MLSVKCDVYVVSWKWLIVMYVSVMIEWMWIFVCDLNFFFFKKKGYSYEYFREYIYRLDILNFWNCLYKVWIIFKRYCIVFMVWCTVFQTVTSNHDVDIIFGKRNRDNHGFIMVWIIVWQTVTQIVMQTVKVDVGFWKLMFEKENFRFDFILSS